MAGLPLRLKNVSISGYRGVSNREGQELHLSDLAARNVFIGQNNGGKSTVYQFLLLTANHLASPGKAFQSLVSAGQLDPNLFWQQNEQVGCSAVLAFTSPGPDFARVDPNGIGGTIVHKNQWRLSIHVQPNGNQGTLSVSPQVWIDTKQVWQDVFQRAGPQGGELSFLSGHGQYVQHSGREKSPFLDGANSLVTPVREWATSGRFFDPFRSLHRGGNNPRVERGFGVVDRRVEDGSGVLGRLFEWQNDSTMSASFQRFRNGLIKRINRLFDNNFAEILLRSTPTLDMSLTLDAPDAIPIPLQSMGSGIAQMVMILASLEVDHMQGEKSFHYHLEEPELHLHPRLLRRFMAQLTDFPTTQFFITSHSNVILDTLREEDRVYLFSQEAAGNCVARPVEGVIKQHAVLDALGVSGSTLLQTNCVIWVEGPSDRLYVRQWINEHAEQQKIELLEGADYSFVFYGGKVMSHFGFEESEDGLEDLIPMLAISRYSAVLMDRDKPPETPECNLSRAKCKILQQADEDTTHRLACITRGREVENDLPLGCLKRAAVAKLKIDAKRFDTLTLTGNDRYPDEIISHLGLTEKAEVESCRRKLEDKVGLARRVLDISKQQKEKLMPHPPYVAKLVEFIVRSKVT